MVDRTIKKSEMEIDCEDSQAQYKPQEEETHSSSQRMVMSNVDSLGSREIFGEDNDSAKNKQFKDLNRSNLNTSDTCTGSSVHDAKTSACQINVAEISGSEDTECLAESPSFGLVSLFDESVVLEDATISKKDTNRRQRFGGKQKKKRKLHVPEQVDVEQGESSGQGRTQALRPKKKPRKTRPNYFVAWRVSNPEILSAIKLVQDSIISHNEILKPAVIPLDTLHITLMVMYLEDSEQIEKANSALENCRTEICSILRQSAFGEIRMAECTADKSLELQECSGEKSIPTASQESVPVAFTFLGLGHFGHQVLFAKVGAQEDIALLKSVASVVREKFASVGILSTDSREFQPHLTVMKLSRKPRLKKKGIKTIPAESYYAFQDVQFGRQPLTQLHLCSMIHPKEKGFYKILGSVELGNNTKNNVNTNCQNDNTDDENEPQI